VVTTFTSSPLFSPASSSSSSRLFLFSFRFAVGSSDDEALSLSLSLLLSLCSRDRTDLTRWLELSRCVEWSESESLAADATLAAGVERHSERARVRSSFFSSSSSPLLSLSLDEASSAEDCLRRRRMEAIWVLCERSSSFPLPSSSA
jgi:hypothetical protein